MAVNTFCTYPGRFGTAPPKGEGDMIPAGTCGTRVVVVLRPKSTAMALYREFDQLLQFANGHNPRSQPILRPTIVAEVAYCCRLQPCDTLRICVRMSILVF